MTGTDSSEIEYVASAAADIVDVVQSLAESNLNIILAVLCGETFVEYEHYPPGDVLDPTTGGQFYFHAHPATREDYNDFGHFHLFLRPSALPDAIDDEASDSTDTICHLIGISVDQRGFPVGLFTTNRWVTDETWHPAAETIDMLSRFSVTVPVPSEAVSRWISAMPILFRSDIEALVHQRDVAIAQWRSRYPDADVFEDRRLEVTSWKRIDLEDRLAEIRSALGLD